MIDMDEQLSVEVPTHLFRFEETVMGMTITQLLCDTGAGVGIWSLWNLPLPLAARLSLCIGAALVTILLVHVQRKGRSLVDWGTLYALYWLTPPRTIWYNDAVPKVLALKKQNPPTRPSVQSTWIRLQAIENSCLVFTEGKQQKNKPTPPTRYSAVLEVTGISIQLLAVEERLRLFNAYKGFLAGLEFPLQIISNNETVDVQSYEPLLLLEQQAEQLKPTPRLAALARSHVQFLRARLGTNIVTRHFVVISASPLEEEVKRVDGKPQSGLGLFGLFGRKKEPAVSEQQVLQQLRIRIKVVREGFREMGLQTHLLDDEGLARFYASSLTPGVTATWGEQALDNLRSMTFAVSSPPSQSAYYSD